MVIKEFDLMFGFINLNSPIHPAMIFKHFRFINFITSFHYFILFDLGYFPILR